MQGLVIDLYKNKAELQKKTFKQRIKAPILAIETMQDQQSNLGLKNNPNIRFPKLDSLA